MKATFEYVTETDKAVCYKKKDGIEFWIPRSVLIHRTKWPDGNHDLTIEDSFARTKKELKEYL